MDESDTGAETAADLSKIWYSRILQSTDVSVDLDYHSSGDRKTKAFECSNNFKLFLPVPRENAPLSLFGARSRLRFPDRCRHAFKVFGGFLVISPKLRDVLIQFDLGRTALFEVPILQADGETPSDYPPHYILHVAETRDCFVPEASDHVRQFVQHGATDPEPGAIWVTDARTDVLAVRSSAAEGADLWADPNLYERIFFSDRLKQAIDAAKVSKNGLDLVEARVLP
ncbi:MAG: DUF1629 domain-containing protein [Pseudomonadota bacterium]